MHWTYSVGLIWLFLCVYAKGHRLLNNIWEKGDDCSAPSFLASGSRGEGVWAKNPCGCWVEAFPEKRCSVCLPPGRRVHSPAQTKMMVHWLTFTCTCFSSSDERLVGTGSPAWQNQGLSTQPAGWGKDMPSVWAWVWVHEASLVSVLLCWRHYNKILQTGWLINQQKFIPPDARGWEVQDQVSSMVLFWWETSSWFIVMGELKSWKILVLGNS